MDIIEGALEIVVDGLFLPECPRWRNGALYYADIQQGRVYRLEQGVSTLIHQAQDDFTGGIGLAGDGALIVVHSKGRRLVRVGSGGDEVHADLSGLCQFVLNDMVVTANGYAYVSQPGFDIWGGHAEGYPPPTDLLMADPKGACSVAATGLMSPNGVAVSPDGRTLYVAESTGMCISAFTIDPATGALSDKRTFATLPDGAIPDGICLDSEGAVWAAAPVRVTADGVDAGPGVIRVGPDGRATHIVPVGAGRRALACVLGGEERSDLYICTVADFSGVAAFSEGSGRLERVKVDFRGAGAP